MSDDKDDLGPESTSTDEGVDLSGSASSEAAEGDDVEGHNMLLSPTLSRDLAKARSAEIDRSVQAKQHQAEAKRVFHR